MSEEKSDPRGCAAILSLVTPLAWPAITMLLLLYLHKPLYRAAESISKKIDEATEIGVRDVLTLKIQQNAKILGGAELAAAIGNLSAEAIERLLHIGEAYFSVASFDQAHRRWVIIGQLDHLHALDELVRAGLVSFRYRGRDDVAALAKIEQFLTSHGFRKIVESPDGTKTWEADHDVTPEETAELREFDYHLTPQGADARKAVIQTIVQILEEAKKTSPK